MDFLTLDNPLTQDLLKIAREIIDSNKNLKIEELFNRARKILKIPRNTLRDILQFLTGNHILVEGSRFTKETVLENAYRRNIFNFIINNKGAHFSLIKKEIFRDESDNEGSSGQFIWHLGLLLKFQLIKKIKVQNRTLFLPFQMQEDEAIAYHWIKDPKVKNILTLLLNQDQCLKSDIIAQVNERRDDIYYRIKILSESNILVEFTGDNQFIGINPAKKDLIQQAINKMQEDMV